LFYLPYKTFTYYIEKYADASEGTFAAYSGIPDSNFSLVTGQHQSLQANAMK
jgi:hypothetical protein